MENLRKSLTKNRNRALCAAVMALCVLAHAVPASAAGIAERILNAWTKRAEYTEGSGAQFVVIKATYYSAEYIEALVRSEAEKNLWTRNEEESYKYNLLKTLNLDENIAFHLDFDVKGVPAYLQPFDRQLKLYVGRTVLEPSDYDKRFNFKLQGQRDGMIWFPRYDAKTGKNLLDGAKEVRLLISGSITAATSRSGGDVRFVWDITGDDPSVLGTGTAAVRLELDRLIRRLDKLKTDKNALEGQLSAINREIAEIDTRVDELQKK